MVSVKRADKTTQVANEAPQVQLPGRLYRRQVRWWWHVQLPGEKSSRNHALKPEGSRRATTDRQLAQEIAFHLWQEAVRAEAREAAMAEHDAQVQRLRTHFCGQMRALKDVIARAEARAEAETARRAKLEAMLNGLRNQLTQMTPCDCCSCVVLRSDLQRIDSGQYLCRSCMDDLHQTVRRQRWQARKPAANQDSHRKPSSVRYCASSVDVDDLLTGRHPYGADVLHAETGG